MSAKIFGFKLADKDWLALIITVEIYKNHYVFYSNQFSLFLCVAKSITEYLNEKKCPKV